MAHITCTCHRGKVWQRVCERDPNGPGLESKRPVLDLNIASPLDEWTNVDCDRKSAQETAQAQFGLSAELGVILNPKVEIRRPGKESW